MYGHCSKLRKDFPLTEEKRLEFINKYKPFVCVNITAKCTHRCWYCVSGAPVTAPLKSIVDEMGADKYIEKILILSGGKLCTYRISGGEPMEHPAFYQILIALLRAGHDVDIVSNLLYGEDVLKDELFQYRNQINFEISYHLGQYLLDKDGEREDKWWRSYTLACKYGHSIRPITPMTAAILSSDCEVKFDRIYKYAKSHDCKCEMNIMELYASTNEGEYPKAYTKEQRDRLWQLRTRYYEDKPTRESIDTITEINRVLFLRGLKCFYMNRLIYVLADGRIIICGSGRPDITEQHITAPFSNAKISDYPEPCAFETCNCVSKGEIACLNPHGITYEKYLEYINKEEGKG
jgi:organic radical activating enzyme